MPITPEQQAEIDAARADTYATRRVVAPALEEILYQPMPVLEHAINQPFTGTYPWVLFVDGLGVLRAAAEVSDVRLHTRVTRWSRMFRPR